LVLAAKTRRAPAGTLSGMSSPSLVVLMLMFGLMALQLRDVYFGGHYMCPRCGARRAGRHAGDCPWGR
jgi:hypothetical protein